MATAQMEKFYNDQECIVSITASAKPAESETAHSFATLGGGQLTQMYAFALYMPTIHGQEVPARSVHAPMRVTFCRRANIFQAQRQREYVSRQFTIQGVWHHVTSALLSYFSRPLIDEMSQKSASGQVYAAVPSCQACPPFDHEPASFMVLFWYFHHLVKSHQKTS